MKPVGGLNNAVKPAMLHAPLTKCCYLGLSLRSPHSSEGPVVQWSNQQKLGLVDGIKCFYFRHSLGWWFPQYHYFFLTATQTRCGDWWLVPLFSPMKKLPLDFGDTQGFHIVDCIGIPIVSQLYPVILGISPKRSTMRKSHRKSHYFNNPKYIIYDSQYIPIIFLYLLLLLLLLLLYYYYCYYYYSCCCCFIIIVIIIINYMFLFVVIIINICYHYYYCYYMLLLYCGYYCYYFILYIYIYNQLYCETDGWCNGA